MHRGVAIHMPDNSWGEKLTLVNEQLALLATLYPSIKTSPIMYSTIAV